MVKEFILTINSKDGSYYISNSTELVRCKNCEHATMTTDNNYCKYCELYTDDDGDPIELYHYADWYCANGIKRNDVDSTIR